MWRAGGVIEPCACGRMARDERPLRVERMREGDGRDG